MKKYKILKNIDYFALKGNILDKEDLKQWFNKKGIKALIKDGIITEEIQKYPKIVAFRCISTKLEYKLDNKTSYYDGVNLDNMLNKGHCVKSGDFEIYQVAKNKNEILTIGDRVSHNFSLNQYVINSFKYKSNTINIEFKNYSNAYWDITNYTKVNPIIQVEGKDLYEGDKYYYVLIKNYQIIDYIVTKTSYKGRENKEQVGPFLTKDSAIEYIKKSILQEAKEKGFVEGVKYKHLSGKYNLERVYFELNGSLFHLLDGNSTITGDPILWQSDKGWIAEIVKEEKFEVGVWYQLYESYALYNGDTNPGFYKGKWANNIIMSCRSEWKIAELSEIQNLLLKEAKKKYPVGTKFKSLCDNKKLNTIYIVKNALNYYKLDTIFSESFAYIYHKGQWATYVPINTDINVINFPGDWRELKNDYLFLMLGKEKITISKGQIFAADGQCCINDWLNWFHRIIQFQSIANAGEISLKLGLYDTLIIAGESNFNTVGCIENVKYSEIVAITNKIKELNNE